MDVSHLLDSLNDDQRQAVASPLKPALVLAGAGSGKTRVLVHRVAWLIQVEGVSPNGILAVTFTNKAAGEMRARIETLLGMPGGSLWIGTFHGLTHRLLRLHWREAGLPQNFQILDSEDQARLLRKVLKALDLDETRWVPREIQWFINAQKDEGLRSKHLNDDGDPTRRQLIKIYHAYEEACQRAGVVDFAMARHSVATPALPPALPPRAGRRVSGYQRHPIQVADLAHATFRDTLRRGRRRSVDLPLARRPR
jgi:DNA helicase-2/ATP-dependent DNA helicase PcrA